MVLFVRGMKCGICGDPIREGEPLAGFPPFVPNRLDPLFMFSDGVFHQSCLEDHPLGSEALAQYAELRERLAPERRICASCGKRIDDPDDYFSTARLVGDSSHPLYRFNFLQLHKRCFGSWPHTAELKRLLSALEASGAWESSSLVSEIDDYEKSARST